MLKAHLLAMTQDPVWLPNRVPIVSEITPLEFYREYVARNLPVIVKGACRHWTAMKWTREYLCSKVLKPVTVAITPDGHGDCVVEGKFVLPFEQQMTLQRFFQVLSNKDRVHYIQKQCSSLDMEFPELMDDVETISWAQEAFDQIPDATNIWIGDKRAVSSMHKDPYENIFCVVAGTKEFTLVPPTDTCYLYKTKYPVAKYTSDFSIQDTEGEIPWVPLDPDEPDWERYPLFQHAHRLIATVEKGDILYLPSLWYHKVKQFEDEENPCIAVNYWYDMKFDSRFDLSEFLDKIAPLIRS